MAQLFNQSEESKYIKRINEHLSQISKLTKQGEYNPYITAWSRAVRESGLAFVKDKKNPNRYKIRNTAENRAAVSQLETAIKKHKPKTKGEIREEAKRELEREEQKKPEKERKKPSARQITERVKAKIKAADLRSKLDYIYQLLGTSEIGDVLSELSHGKKASERGSEIFDEIGRINETYQRLLSGELTEEEEQARAALADIENDYAFTEEGENVENLASIKQRGRERREYARRKRKTQR